MRPLTKHPALVLAVMLWAVATPGLAGEALAGPGMEAGVRRAAGGLRLAGRLRLARRQVKGGVRRAVKQLRLPGRLRLARRKVATSRTGRTLARLGSGLVRARNSLGGRMTHTADAIEGGLPAPLARGLHRVREHNPLALGSYLWMKFRKDPVFLGTYGGVSSALDKLATPLLMGAGYSAPAAVLLPDLVSVPLGLAVVTMREHALRDDPSRSYAGTLARMVQQYRGMTHQRRQLYRRQYLVEHGGLTWRTSP